MKLSFISRLPLLAAILSATAHRLPAPISEETQTPTPTNSASPSANLPRIQVAVAKVKDLRATAGEPTKMELELKVSSNEVAKDVQAFRIAIAKAVDDTGLDLITPHSNGREFEDARGSKDAPVSSKN